MNQKTILIIIGTAATMLIIVCFGCILITILASPSRQPPPEAVQDSPSQATAINPTSAPPSSALSYDDIVKNAKQMTELKRNDYYKSLVGKNVHAIGAVADVTDAGNVNVRISGTFGYDLVLTEVPKTTSAALNLRDKIEFDGTISVVEDLFGSGRPFLTLKFISLKRR